MKSVSNHNDNTQRTKDGYTILQKSYRISAFRRLKYNKTRVASSLREELKKVKTITRKN